MLGAWARLWARNPERHEFAKPNHLRACMALATLAMAAIVYAVPTPRTLGIESNAALLDLFAIGVWLLVFLVLARWSTSETEAWFTKIRASIRARTGMVTVERIGLLAGLFLAIAVPAVDPAKTHTGRTEPLRVAIVICFIAFLTDRYTRREPSQAAVPVAPTVPDTDTDGSPSGIPPDGYAAHTYSWHLSAGTVEEDCQLTLNLNLQRYAELQANNPKTGFHEGQPDFGDWIVRGATPEVDQLAAVFGRWCAERGWSSFVEVCLVLSFAQHFVYRSDEESKGEADYWRYPIETLHDGEGDCEDMTILAATLLRRMGHLVAVFVTDDHAALAVSAPPGLIQGQFMERDGVRYYYCETTASGWRVGELPDAVDTAELRIVPVGRADLAEAI